MSELTHVTIEKVTGRYKLVLNQTIEDGTAVTPMCTLYTHRSTRESGKQAEWTLVVSGTFFTIKTLFEAVEDLMDWACNQNQVVFDDN